MNSKCLQYCLIHKTGLSCEKNGYKSQLGDSQPVTTQGKYLAPLAATVPFRIMVDVESSSHVYRYIYSAAIKDNGRFVVVASLATLSS